MHPLRVAAVCLLLFTVSLSAQTPKFEVASVRPTPDGATSTLGVRVTGTQVRINGQSLKDYIGMAYSMEPPNVIAPEWTAQQRFDIAANLPAGGTREQIPQMIEALLAERFKLKVHKESREFPIYALTVGKSGLKITGTPIDPNAPPPPVSASGTGSPTGVIINMGAGAFGLADNKLEVRKLTMAQLAFALTRFSERKTIDATGLTALFDFSLELSPEDYQFALFRAAVNNGYVVSAQALRALDTAPSNVLGQYITKTGLQLEERRMAFEVVVVDSASKTPTDN